MFFGLVYSSKNSQNEENCLLVPPGCCLKNSFPLMTQVWPAQMREKLRERAKDTMYRELIDVSCGRGMFACQQGIDSFSLVNGWSLARNSELSW